VLDVRRLAEFRRVASLGSLPVAGSVPRAERDLGITLLLSGTGTRVLRLLPFLRPGPW
jgi:hypothetical protein